MGLNNSARLRPARWLGMLATSFASLFLLTISPEISVADASEKAESGRFTVAVKDNLRPLGFRTSDGQLQGFEIDIARRLAEELRGSAGGLVLEPVLNQNRLSIVLEGEAQLAIARVTATAARSRLVSFSIPYYLDGTALVTSDPSILALADLAGRKVAVLNQSSTVDVLRNRLPQAELVGVESYEAARSLLEQGGAVAFAADASVLTGWVQEFPRYRLLLPTLSTEPLVIVLPKGLQFDALRRQINAILSRWQAEGWLRERATYWGLP